MAKLQEWRPAKWRTIIHNKKHLKWINEGRFTLFSGNNGYLMIFIRDLNLSDEGEYRIRVQDQYDFYMTLKIKEGQFRIRIFE